MLRGPQCFFGCDIQAQRLPKLSCCGSPSGDIDRILESSSGRRLVALAIFVLGQLRDSAQLFNLAVEHLIVLSTIKGILH